jgi:hypothetical protein
VKYRKKASLIDATQWLTHGDHSQVQKFPEQNSSKSLPGNPYCPDCGNLMLRHGLLDGVNGEEIVCPGDYIVTDRNELHYRLSRGEFEGQYEPYVRPPSYTKHPLSDLEQRKQDRHPHKESV